MSKPLRLPLRSSISSTERGNPCACRGCGRGAASTAGRGQEAQVGWEGAERGKRKEPPSARRGASTPGCRQHSCPGRRWSPAAAWPCPSGLRPATGGAGRWAVGCVGGGATRIAVTRGRDATMAALPSLAQNGCLLQPVRGQSSLFVHREGHFFSMAAPRARTTPILCTLELAMRT